MNRGLIATGAGVGLAVVLGLFFFFDRKEESAEAPAVASLSATSETQSPSETPSAEAATAESADGGATQMDDAAQTDDPAQSDSGTQADEVSEETSEATAAAVQEAALPPATAETSGVAEAGEVEASAEEDAVGTMTPPSFDVVRVEQSGEGVIAGRAPPGSLVLVYDGETLIGEVRADAAGNWVLILASALAPGNHELRLVVRLDNGEELHAEKVAIISLSGPKTVEAIKEAGEHGLAAIEEAKGPAPTTTAALEGNGTDSSLVAPASVESGTVASASVATGSEEPLVVLVPDETAGASKLLQGSSAALKGQGIKDDALVLNSIDYDEEGKAVVAGRGEPGSKVVIYLDNQPLAAAKVDEAGNWPAVLDKPIEPGLHSLRVDQVDDAGDVVARVETPFARADLSEEDFAEGAVVVQPGNSLWRIARRVYGEGIRYSVIYQANNEQIRDPHLIYPGQIFTIPKVQ